MARHGMIDVALWDVYEGLADVENVAVGIEAIQGTVRDQHLRRRLASLRLAVDRLDLALRRSWRDPRVPIGRGVAGSAVAAALAPETTDAGGVDAPPGSAPDRGPATARATTPEPVHG